MQTWIHEMVSLLRNRGRLMRSIRRTSRLERLRLAESVKAIGPWFHNYEIASGVWTNPEGTSPGFDYPAWRWGFISPLLREVQGKTCLDVGCSSGFFSLKLSDLGAAQVLGVDDGEQIHALEQARFAARQLNLNAEFQKRSVYQVSELGRQFDLVLCLGVLYHLRHPLLALESLRSVCRGTLILQTITTKHLTTEATELPVELLKNLDLRSPVLSEPGFPALKFIEHALGPDTTCWFVPNPEAVYAMLRSAGFAVEEVIFPTEHEIIVKATAR